MGQNFMVECLRVTGCFLTLGRGLAGETAGHQTPFARYGSLRFVIAWARPLTPGAWKCLKSSPLAGGAKVDPRRRDLPSLTERLCFDDSDSLR